MVERLLGLLLRLMLLVHQGIETDEVVVLTTALLGHSRDSLSELCELFLLFLVGRRSWRCHVLVGVGC